MSAMMEAIKIIKEDAYDAESIEESNYLLKVGAYLTVCTAASLRGYECFYTELAGLRRFIHIGREGVIPHPLNAATVLTEEQCMALPHVVLPLLGKFKGEIGIDHHVINLANESISGLQHGGGWRSSSRSLTSRGELQGLRSQRLKAISFAPPMWMPLSALTCIECREPD